MSWMDSWSRPSKSQATPAPYYLLPGGENTPYCHSCGRVISSKRSANSTAAAAAKDKEVKYCSSRCRNHKPGKLDREIEEIFVGFLTGEIEKAAAPGTGEGPVKASKSHKVKKNKKAKGDARVLVSCDEVERHVFPHDEAGSASDPEDGHTDGYYTDCAAPRQTQMYAQNNSSHEDNELQGSAAHSSDKLADSMPENEISIEGFNSSDTIMSYVLQAPRAPSQPSQRFESSQASPDFRGQLPDRSVGGSGTFGDNVSDAPEELDYDRLARLSIRSGTRVRPAQNVSEVNGSVGGEKGRAERIEESEAMLDKRREGLRRVKQREMVRCAARRGVVFGFLVPGGNGGDSERMKCEAVMSSRLVVEPSYAKGNWSIRFRE